MLWDLYRDGITQSLLCKWIICPHRFWLYTIRGVKEDDGSFPYKLEYGNAFHMGLDTYAMGRAPSIAAGNAIRGQFSTLRSIYPSEGYAIGHWSRICQAQFRAYVYHWFPEDSTYESLEEECAFRLPYTLPSGRVVILRGKRDAVVQKQGTHSNWLMEHKCKGDVDEAGLMATLDQNIQTMFYFVPLVMGQHPYKRPEGVLYNVIRRPLGMGKHNIRKRKATKKIPAESNDEFYARLEGLMMEHPKDFFHRWKVAITDYDVNRFRTESLDPLLERLCDWYDSIKDDPQDPWKSRLHYRRPFGIFDPLGVGMHGDYWEFLTTGKQTNLKKVTTVFPELDVS